MFFQVFASFFLPFTWSIEAIWREDNIGSLQASPLLPERRGGEILPTAQTMGVRGQSGHEVLYFMIYRPSLDGVLGRSILDSFDGEIEHVRADHYITEPDLARRPCPSDADYQNPTRIEILDDVTGCVLCSVVSLGDATRDRDYR